MSANGFLIRSCDKCGTYTKHEIVHTPEDVTKKCLVCKRIVVSNRNEYARKVAKNRAGRRRAELENIPRRDD